MTGRPAAVATAASLLSATPRANRCSVPRQERPALRTALAAVFTSRPAAASSKACTPSACRSCPVKAFGTIQRLAFGPTGTPQPGLADPRGPAPARRSTARHWSAIRCPARAADTDRPDCARPRSGLITHRQQSRLAREGRSPNRHASADKLQAVAGAPDRPVLFSLPLIMAPRCAASGSPCEARPWARGFVYVCSRPSAPALGRPRLAGIRRRSPRPALAA